eukprot:1949375-Alexandrium_andersonii.AAC.1
MFGGAGAQEIAGFRLPKRWRSESAVAWRALSAGLHATIAASCLSLMGSARRTGRFRGPCHPEPAAAGAAGGAEGGAEGTAGAGAGAGAGVGVERSTVSRAGAGRVLVGGRHRSWGA